MSAVLAGRPRDARRSSIAAGPSSSATSDVVPATFRRTRPSWTTSTWRVPSTSTSSTRHPSPTPSTISSTEAGRCGSVSAADWVWLSVRTARSSRSRSFSRSSVGSPACRASASLRPLSRRAARDAGIVAASEVAGGWASAVARVRSLHRSKVRGSWAACRSAISVSSRPWVVARARSSELPINRRCSSIASRPASRRGARRRGRRLSSLEGAGEMRARPHERVGAAL